MYCSDESYKTLGNEKLSSMERPFTNKPSLQSQRSADHEFTQHGNLRDQDMPSDSFLFETISERSPPKSSESSSKGVEVTQQPSSSLKPSERITSFPEVSLLDATGVTRVTDILLTKDKTPHLDTQLDKKLPVDSAGIATPCVSKPLPHDTLAFVATTDKPSVFDIQEPSASSRKLSKQMTDSLEITLREPISVTVDTDMIKTDDPPQMENRPEKLPRDSPGKLPEKSSVTEARSVDRGVEVQQYLAPSGEPCTKVSAPTTVIESTDVLLTKDKPRLEDQPDKKLAGDSPGIASPKVKSSMTWSRSVARDVQQPFAPTGRSSLDSHEEVVKLPRPTALTRVTDILSVRPVEGQDQSLHSDLLIFETKPERSSESRSDVKVDEIQQLSISNLSSLSADQPQDVYLEDQQDLRMPGDLPVPETMPEKSPVMRSKSTVGAAGGQVPLTFSGKPVVRSPDTRPTDQERRMKVPPGLSTTSPAMLLKLSSPEAAEGSLDESTISVTKYPQDLSNLSVKTHEMARFVCCIEPQSLSKYVWYHNSRRLATTERIKYEQSGNVLSLFVYNTQPEDQGVYSCVVESVDGKTQRASAQLQVEGGYVSSKHLILPSHVFTCLSVSPTGVKRIPMFCL